MDAEMFIEHDGILYDMKPHAPIPGVPTATQHFVDSIVNDKPHIATGEEGHTVMQVLDAIYASAAKGEPVRLQ
jgi:predicted dehydrogenase